ncbi:thermonuclease family protein [Neorhizobium sp. P12A]|nr:thermonuclease family protein [Neorhizobium sp. P12A]
MIHDSTNPILEYEVMGGMRRTLRRTQMIGAIFSLSFLLPSVATASPIIGRATVIDGDTLEIGQTRIRLSGVDAPEHDQICTYQNDKLYLCGQEAATALDAWLSITNGRNELYFADRQFLFCENRRVEDEKRCLSRKHLVRALLMAIAL